MVNVNAFYRVEGWMINEFKGSELSCFAIIYSYSCGEMGRFVGGFKNLAEMMKCGEATVSRALESLLTKELIQKEEITTATGRRTFYVTNEKKVNEIRKKQLKIFEEGVLPKRKYGYFQNESMGTFKTEVYNEYNNNENNKEKRLSNDNQKAEGFDLFWETYDYKKGKVKAESAWKKMTKVQKEEAIKAIPLYKEDCKRNDRQMKHPATYLNQRTWEDDFTCNGKIREEKEESAQVQEMSEVEAIVWKNNQEWMEKMVPRLKDRITYDDFCKMRAMAHFKADVYADILVHIEKSGYDGDIVDEFDRMCETEYYERIWGNG